MARKRQLAPPQVVFGRLGFTNLMARKRQPAPPQVAQAKEPT